MPEASAVSKDCILFDCKNINVWYIASSLLYAKKNYTNTMIDHHVKSLPISF